MALNPAEIVLAVLEEARSSGRSPLMRTSLVKFLYLVDCYFAEKNEGKSASGWDWKFVHFGPYSQAAMRTVEDLVAKGLIFAETREVQDSDAEYALYSVSASKKIPDFRALGHGGISLRLQADMRRFASDLPKLLDHVYFHTGPMLEARPGNNLDFSECRPANPEDFRQVEMKRLPTKAVKRVRSRLAELAKERVSRASVEEGPYDQTYYEGMALLECSPIPDGISGEARIAVFEKDQNGD